MLRLASDSFRFVLLHRACHLQGSSAPPLRLTERCISRIKQVTSDEQMLRVSVDGGGCSGWQYKFEIDQKICKDDSVVECDGAKLVVDSTSLDVMKGSTIDFAEELIRSAFVVTDNPQAEQGCSCGVSFALK